MDKWKAVGGENLFPTEPEFKCPDCGEALHTEWDDNGFGPYSVQMAPYYCECGWNEDMPFSHVPKHLRPKSDA